MSLKFFVKILLMSGHDSNCAEINSLALAVATGMKLTQESEETGLKAETPSKDFSRTIEKESQRKAYTSDSDSDNETFTDMSNTSSPLSHRQKRLHQIRRRSVELFHHFH